MIHRSLWILPNFMLLSIGLSAQTLVSSSSLPKDILPMKSKGIYVALAPLVGKSLNTDNNIDFDHVGVNLSVNWITRKRKKFAGFGTIATGSSSGSKSLNFYEAGFLMGKVVQGRRNGFFDLNIGIAALGRKGKSPWLSLGWGPSVPSVKEVREVHTIGVPFAISLNTLRGDLGIGVGVSGNLNINQPYAALTVRLRFGSVIEEKSE